LVPVAINVLGIEVGPTPGSQVIVAVVASERQVLGPGEFRTVVVDLVIVDGRYGTAL
jgi:hypothetical protein